jgi:hypothetical protein
MKTYKFVRIQEEVWEVLMDHKRDTGIPLSIQIRNMVLGKEAKNDTATKTHKNIK